MSGKKPWTGEKGEQPKKKIPKVGVINRKLVKSILFSLIGLAILISVSVSVLAIWDYIGRDIAYKTVATLAALMTGGLAFSWANDYFGSQTDGNYLDE